MDREERCSASGGVAACLIYKKYINTKSKPAMEEALLIVSKQRLQSQLDRIDERLRVMPRVDIQPDVKTVLVEHLEAFQREALQRVSKTVICAPNEPQKVTTPTLKETLLNKALARYIELAMEEVYKNFMVNLAIVRVRICHTAIFPRFVQHWRDNKMTCFLSPDKDTEFMIAEIRW